jgi:hypothetical protein
MGCFSAAAWVVLAASITLVSARPVTTISTLTPRYDTVDQDYTIGGILIPVTIAIAFAILLRAIVLRARRRRAYHPQPRPQQVFPLLLWRWLTAPADGRQNSEVVWAEEEKADADRR